MSSASSKTPITPNLPFLYHIYRQSFGASISFKAMSSKIFPQKVHFSTKMAKIKAKLGNEPIKSTRSTFW